MRSKACIPLYMYLGCFLLRLQSTRLTVKIRTVEKKHVHHHTSGMDLNEVHTPNQFRAVFLGVFYRAQKKGFRSDPCLPCIYVNHRSTGIPVPVPVPEEHFCSGSGSGSGTGTGIPVDL